MTLNNMVMNKIDFEKQLKYGKDWEDRFAQWLISRGWYVTPKYLFTEEGAPLLIGENNKYAIPDIDAAKDGIRIWFECKRKKMMFQYYATGYPESNHICYKKVQEITGDKVFVIFEDDANRYDNQKYYGNYINEMEKHIFRDNWIIQGKPHIIFKYPEAFIGINLINEQKQLELAI